MPDNKLQHYVPKCHLRPFSLTEGQAAINLYNIRQEKCIESAPIKGQCARPYFYGKDLGLEKALQEPEGAYAAIVKKAIENVASIHRSDLVILREFTLLQTFRTYGNIEKLLMIAKDQHADLVAAGKGKNIPAPFINTIGEAVQIAFEHFAHGIPQVADLDVCLIVNKAQRDFITSDDPAISTNRLHLQKMKENAFGLASAGSIFLLPLTPRLAFIAFDANVYHIPDKRGDLVTINKNQDVKALNDLQYLHAKENLYYAHPGDGQQVIEEFKVASALRPEKAVTWEYFEKTSEVGNSVTFQQVDKMDFNTSKEYLSSFHVKQVQPTRWMDFLRYKLRPKFVDTRTSAGVVRLGHPALSEFRPSKERINVMRRRRSA